MTTMRIVRSDGTVLNDATRSDVSEAWLDERQLVWIDFDRAPDSDERQVLLDTLGLSEQAVEHIARPHVGPRAVRYRSHLLVVIYDVDLTDGATVAEKDEVVLLIGDRFLVSAHGPSNTRVSGASDHIEATFERFGPEIGSVVFPILDAIAEHYLRVVDEVRQKVEVLERRVLMEEEQGAIPELYQLRRALTVLRRVIAPEESLIGARANQMTLLANPDIQDALLDVKHNMQSAVDDIEQYLSILPDILTTFESLKSDNLNRIVKLLTVWSIILTAVALLPTVLGMSFATEPSVSPYVGYVFSVAVMLVVGGSIWYLFKRSGWVE